MPNEKKFERKPNMVQKANPLLSLSSSSFSLLTLKILDAYLSKINIHKKDKKFISFDKPAIEKLFGTSKLNISRLQHSMSELKSPVKILDDTELKLFDIADCIFDTAFGIYVINLSCSEEAEEYFFNIETSGYLGYELKEVACFSSKYSYSLYLYLKKLQNDPYHKSYTYELYELREMLNCTAKSYDQFKMFNQKVLKECQAEITSKTDLRYEYKAVKKGRFVVGIEFTVTNKRKKASKKDKQDKPVNNASISAIVFDKE